MMACTLGVWAAVRPSSAQQAAMLSTATTTVRHTGLRQTTQAGPITSSCYNISSAVK